MFSRIRLSFSKCRDVIDVVVAMVFGGSPHEHSVYALSFAVSYNILSPPLTMAHMPGGPCVKKIFAHVLEEEDTRLSLWASNTVESKARI